MRNCGHGYRFPHHPGDPAPDWSRRLCAACGGKIIRKRVSFPGFLNSGGGLERLGIRAALAPAIAIFFDDRECTKPLDVPPATTRVNLLHNPTPSFLSFCRLSFDRKAFKRLLGVAPKQYRRNATEAR